ncbi:MAG: DUF6448 family protein [Abditibacteriaceae bacterium]
MSRSKLVVPVFALLTVLAAVLLLSNPSFAHCDGRDGPVVIAAQKALDSGNVNLILPWVPKNDEAEVGRAFEHTLSVRKLGAEAKALADTYFFETVVRLHRVSEGEPYTGLKPAGRDLGPAIPAADKSLEIGSTVAVEKLLVETFRKGLHERFQAAMELKDFSPNDVEAGRHYVEAYVPYFHYVEELWSVASGPADGHHAEDANASGHSH